MKYDLHCHSNCSDGTLTPTELVGRAIEMGVQTLAITDHDTINAYHHLNLKESLPIKIVPGIEFSSCWGKMNIHIVGLNVQLDSDSLKAGVAFQNIARQKRAAMIANKLVQLGFKEALAGATAIANNGNIGRPHFAQYLVNIGAVSDINQAFKKFLGSGKPGDIKQFWADIPQIVRWINEAGGTAVLAHPKKYQLTRTRLKHLLDNFIEAGGQGMEVISGRQDANITKDLAGLCVEKKLLASCGSDFHRPGQAWAELGRISELPIACSPVWEHW